MKDTNVTGIENAKVRKAIEDLITAAERAKQSIVILALNPGADADSDVVSAHWAENDLGDTISQIISETKLFVDQYENPDRYSVTEAELSKATKDLVVQCEADKKRFFRRLEELAAIEEPDNRIAVLASEVLEKHRKGDGFCEADRKLAEIAANIEKSR